MGWSRRQAQCFLPGGVHPVARPLDSRAGQSTTRIRACHHWGRKCQRCSPGQAQAVLELGPDADPTMSRVQVGRAVWPAQDKECFTLARQQA